MTRAPRGWSSLGRQAGGSGGPMGGPPSEMRDVPPRPLSQLTGGWANSSRRLSGLDSELSRLPGRGPAPLCAHTGPRDPSLPPGVFLLPFGAPRGRIYDFATRRPSFSRPGQAVPCAFTWASCAAGPVAVPHFTPPGRAALILPVQPSVVWTQPSVVRTTVGCAPNRRLSRQSKTTSRASPSSGFEPASPQVPP
jgi:hypothetical protein